MAGNIPAKHYKTSELISKFGRLAQTSQYYVLISPDSKRAISRVKPEKPFIFDSSFVGEDLGMYCSEASLPGNSFATSETTTDFPGVSQKFPYRKIYNDLQLTFYVDSSYNVIKFFENWMSYIASPYGYGIAINEESGQTGSFRFNYPDLYKCNIFIAKFNKDEGLYDRISYRFINAFPIDITSMPVSYDASDVLKCSVSFSYDRYIFDREGKFIAPSSPSSPGETPANPPSSEVPNILGNTQSELEKLRGEAARESLNRTPLGRRILAGGATSPAANQIGADTLRRVTGQ